MKIPLTLQLAGQLRIERKPVGFDGKGGIVVEENRARTRYIVYDASSAA